MPTAIGNNKPPTTQNLDISDYNKKSGKDKKVEKDKTSEGFSFKDLHSKVTNSSKGMHALVGKTTDEQINMAQQMLLKQLQCQTPDNAMDPNAMMETMMSMLTITQQGQLVDMEKQSMELQKALFTTSLSSFEGEYIEHAGEKFDYNEHEDQEIVFSLPAKAKSVLLRIFDSNQRCINEIEIDQHEVGRNSYTWDGKAKDGSDMKKGIYSTSITAFDEKDKPIIVPTRLKSRITEIAYDEKELAVPFSGRIPIYNIKRRTMANQAAEHYQRHIEQIEQSLPNRAAEVIQLQQAV